MKKIIYCLCVMCVFASGVFGLIYAQGTKTTLSDVELNRFYGVTPLLLSMHTEIGEGHSDDEIIASYANLLQNMKYFADIDVISYLKTVVYPQTSIENFLSKTLAMMNTATSFSVYLDGQKQYLVQDKSTCDDVKSLADKNFSSAMKDINSASIEKFLNMSIDNEKCSVENRILYNAYSKMQEYIKYYYDILNKKYEYFNNYKYDILNLL